MFDRMTPDEFDRYLAVVAHTMAYRRFLRHHPGVGRAAAWEHAVAHWRDYREKAIDFLAFQTFREDDRRAAHDRRN